MKGQIKKLFVIRKYVMAVNAAEALRKEKNIAADECWLDDDYKKKMAEQLPSAIGFEMKKNEE